MKTTSRLILMICATSAVVSAAGPSESEAITRAEIGAPAPDFTLVDSKGAKRTLSEHKGKLVILEWINPQCPYVVNCYRTGAMQRAYEQVRALDKGVVWLAVNTTDGTSQQENELWINRYDLKYPILLDFDGEVGRRYDARGTPHMYVIDAEGILRYQGAIDDNKLAGKRPEDVTNYVVNAVRQIVNGETVSPDRTKPYGCSVKYPPKGR
jgi:peroxiredoxin